MTIELQQRLNTALLGFISIVVPLFAALVWKVYGGLPEAVAQIRTDVADIKNTQGGLATVQDQRLTRIEKDIDRLEARAR